MGTEPGQVITATVGIAGYTEKAVFQIAIQKYKWEPETDVLWKMKALETENQRLKKMYTGVHWISIREGAE